MLCYCGGWLRRDSTDSDGGIGDMTGLSDQAEQEKKKSALEVHNPNRQNKTPQHIKASALSKDAKPELSRRERYLLYIHSSSSSWLIHVRVVRPLRKNEKESNIRKLLRPVKLLRYTDRLAYCGKSACFCMHVSSFVDRRCAQQAKAELAKLAKIRAEREMAAKRAEEEAKAKVFHFVSNAQIEPFVVT